MKILFLGDAAVGKTSLIRKILGTNFQPIYIPTESITREIIYFYGEEHELIDVSGMRKFELILQHLQIMILQLLYMIRKHLVKT